MPGKYDDYLCSLRKLLNFVDLQNPDKEELMKWILRSFNSKNEKCSIKYIYLLKNIKQIIEVNNKFELTISGKIFLENNDKTVVYDALNNRYTGIEEIMELLLEQPLSLDDIGEALRKNGLSMVRDTQFKIRLGWLQSLGYVINMGSTYMLNKENIPTEMLRKSK